MLTATDVMLRCPQSDEEAKQEQTQAHSVAAPSFHPPEPHYRSGATASSSAGLTAQHDALSLKALTQRFYVWFKDSGMLAALQTQFRAQIIQQIPRRHLITSGGAAAAANADASLLTLRSTKDQTLLQRATNSLIMDYFREFDYPFALSIFGPESGSAGAANASLTTEDILAVLRLQTKSNGHGAPASNEWIAKRIRRALNDDGDDEEEGAASLKENRALSRGSRAAGRSASAAPKTDRSRFPKRSLLALLLDSLAAQPAPPVALEISCQTDPDTGSKDALSIDSKFREIDRQYLGKQIEDSAMVFPQLQEKMLRFEREQAERFTIEMEVEKRRYADSEGARIRAEERARYRADEDRLRKELRKESEAHLVRMRKETEEVIAKYQSKERELSDSNFRERQQLQENMNLLHAREVEMARKRDVMERTQSLAEAKIKEADRMLLARSTELDFLSNNLQSKINDEKKRVRVEWEQQVLKRDELIESLSETLKSVESKLARKTTELAEALKLMDDYEREMHTSSSGRKIGETKIVELQHQLGLAQTALGDTEARRAKLEEQLLAATAKEQVCFHHVAELGALRARVQSQSEEFEQASRSAREKHAQDLEAERQQAQQALLAGHTAASNLVAQWKSSYVELAQELERRRSEEERAKQALEEESLVTRELKREVAALRAGLAKAGAGFHIAALPSAAPSAAPFLPGLSEMHKRVGGYVPEHPTLSSGAAGATTIAAFESISPAVAASQFQPTQLPPAVVSPSSAAATPSAPVPASVQSAANSLDAEFFAREQALELETQALSHSVGMHAARERIDTESERRERAKEHSVQAGTQRHLQLTSVARDYALNQVLSSTSPVTSESEPAFAANAAARDQDLAREREAYLKLAATQESERRTKQAADALELRRKELEWQQEKLEQDRRAAAQQQQAAAADERAKQAEAQRLEDEAAARQVQAQKEAADAAAAAASESARVATAAAAEAEARRATAASTAPAVPASAPDTIAEDTYDARAEEELAAKLRADREQRERMEKDREARLARRMEERAAQARLAPLAAAAPVLAPAPASSPEEDPAARQKAEADRAVRELEAEKEARRAVLREEERQRRERAEREAAEQEVQRQRQAEAEAAAATAAATAAAYSDPSAATAAAVPADDTPYDEAATAAYWATQGYWDPASGLWIAYTEEQKTQMREYAEYEAAQLQQQQQQAYATDVTQQQPYGLQADAAAAGPPVLPADPYDDAISEASAEISAPQSDAEF